MFDFSVLSQLPFLLSGFEITVLLALTTAVTTTVTGLVLAIGRLYGPKWLSVIVTFYIDTMRAIPELAVLVWIYFSVPILIGLPLPPFWAALLAMTIQVSAYAAEMYRAGITSVRRGQTQAGLSLGMSGWEILTRILLPQAFIRMLPNYGSFLTVVIKDTAIASMVAVPELMRNSEALAMQIYRPVELYTIAIILYFCLLFPTTRLINIIYRRIAHLGRS
ncbi:MULTISPECIES: amino acid ABC transporter permease [unclassified Chelatococcus]|uniref:amino acid ABC transporter permease n=1 Tax=unclassified Chelatococcus TaxID=2638111 RepID=UPI001BCE0066|nr:MULTISPECIES: amino acid ABC transporter permease [unclassified Chelatococcus]MBS7701602.1 amino acid ABC transporter permease [Chelatococcus sp. YT9]MBX3559717.1 amino acid ABC transporter permease [Chelatococcus sp.]